MKRLLMTVIAVITIAPTGAYCIGYNASHAFNKDGLWGAGDTTIIGGATRYRPDLDSIPDGVALDEVYLFIRFKDGQSPTENSIKDIRYDGTVICTPSGNDMRRMIDPSDPHVLLVWYGFHDQDAEETVSSGNRSWDFLVDGADPVSEVWIFVSYHRTGHAAMPDLYTTGDDFPSPTGLLAVQSAASVDAETDGQPMTGVALDSAKKKVIVLIHGWNAEGDGPPADPSQVTVKNQFASASGHPNSGFQNLAVRAFENPLVSSEGWQVARYDWHDDAATGLTPFIDAANATRDGACAHGLKLGQLLAAISPTDVQFIAHSAGNWAAKRASAYLKHRFPSVRVQITSLDPFVNDDDPISIGDDLDLEDDFMLTRIITDYAENYYAEDVPTDYIWIPNPIFPYIPPFIQVGVWWTSGDYDGWDVNRQIETLGSSGLYDSSMHTHSGPVAWLGETADPDNLANDTLRQLHEGFINSMPLRLWSEANDARVDDFPGQSSSVGVGSATWYNYRATKQSGEPNHAGNSGGASMWLSWTAPLTGAATITTSGSSFDTVLAVYTGTSLGGLNFVAANDDFGVTPQSKVTFTAQAGQVYRIAVDGYAGEVGKVVLNWAVEGAIGSSYVITASVVGNHGSIDPSGNLSVMPGDPISFTAYPDSGYTVDTWDLDGEIHRGGSRFTIENVQTNHILKVTFEEGTSSGDYAIGDFATCRYVDPSTEECSEPTDTFECSDSRLYAWAELEDILSRVTGSFKLYRPNGTRYGTLSWTIPDPGEGYYWPVRHPSRSWPISGTEIGDTLGTWEVRLYIEGEYIRSISVMIADTQPPIITCPADIVTTTDTGKCTAAVSFAPVVTDNCRIASVVCEPPSGTDFPIGTTTVNCTATDGGGNSSSCGFSITVSTCGTNPPVVVSQNVTLDFNTVPPTYTGDPALEPYVIADMSGPTPDTWKAIIDTDRRKLIISSGVTITTVPAPAKGNNRRAPGIEIHTCELEVQKGAVIEVNSINKQAGDIVLDVLGDIVIDGTVVNSVTGTQGRPGAIRISSLCLNFDTGPDSRLTTYGQDDGGSDINIATCGAGDVSIKGLVDASYKARLASTIRISAFDGSVNIDGTHSFGTEVVAGTLRTITSGVSVRSRRDPLPGTIAIQASDNVNVQGSTLLSKKYPNYGAVAVKTMSNSSKGGLIDVRAINGNIAAIDRAFDDENRFNDSAVLSLQAGNSIGLTVSGSVNDGAKDNTKAVVSTQAGDTGKGGTNFLRAFNGGISLGLHAQVLANYAGRPGANGANQFTSCTGAFNSGTVAPPAQDDGACGNAPDPLFLDCGELGF